MAKAMMNDGFYYPPGMVQGSPPTGWSGTEIEQAVAQPGSQGGGLEGWYSICRLVLVVFLVQDYKGQ